MQVVLCVHGALLSPWKYPALPSFTPYVGSFCFGKFFFLCGIYGNVVTSCHKCKCFELEFFLVGFAQIVVGGGRGG